MSQRITNNHSPIANRQLAIELVPPAELVPADYNPRRIGPDALKRLARLLDEHGFVDPIIARREDRLIIGGHQRLAANAMRKRPDERVPVIFLSGVSDEKAKALNVALNNPHAQGEWDNDKLGGLLEELKSAELDVTALTAFPSEDVGRLIAEAAGADPGAPGVNIDASFQVAVECRDEEDQRAVYERMTAEGYRCRCLNL